jgi:hypothetical protein
MEIKTVSKIGDCRIKEKDERWQGDMEKTVYITEDEREKCRNIIDAFAELIEGEDMAVLDAGKYGFVKLRYYNPKEGFDMVETFVNSEELFDDLWEEWLNVQLFSFVKGTPMIEMEYKDIFDNLSLKEQEKLLNMRHYFEEKAKLRC